MFSSAPVCLSLHTERTVQSNGYSWMQIEHLARGDWRNFSRQRPLLRNGVNRLMNKWAAFRTHVSGENDHRKYLNASFQKRSPECRFPKRTFCFRFVWTDENDDVMVVGASYIINNSSRQVLINAHAPTTISSVFSGCFICFRVDGRNDPNKQRAVFLKTEKNKIRFQIKMPDSCGRGLCCFHQDVRINSSSSCFKSMCHV